METGTFSNNFSYYKKAIDYLGKYLTIWQIETEGGLQLISEITGSIKYIEHSELPLSILQMPDTKILTKPAVNATSLAIKSLDDQIAALVVLRSGKDFAKH